MGGQGLGPEARPEKPRALGNGLCWAMGLGVCRAGSWLQGLWADLHPCAIARPESEPSKNG